MVLWILGRSREIKLLIYNSSITSSWKQKNINPNIISRLKAKKFIISCPPKGIEEGHPSRRLINKILELDANAEIYKTAGCNFVFHKGIDINCKSQTPAGIYSKMDGKVKR